MTRKKEIIPSEKYADSLAIVRAAKIGRPTTFNQEIADFIIYQMTENGVDLANACKKCKMPKSTIYTWAATNPDFSAALDEARQAVADHCAHMIIELGNSVEDPMKDRIRLDSLKWIASRYHPKAYSEKGSMALTGANGGPVQLQAVQSVPVESLSEQDREAFKRALLAASKAAGEDVSEYED